MRDNTVLIDWLSITSKIHTVTDMMALIGFPDVSTWQLGKGMHGYTYRYWRDNISIHFGGQRTVADFLREGKDEDSSAAVETAFMASESGRQRHRHAIPKNRTSNLESETKVTKRRPGRLGR